MKFAAKKRKSSLFTFNLISRRGAKRKKKQVSWIVLQVHGVTYNPVVCFASVNRFREGKQQQQQ